MVATRTPSNQGALYWLTQATPGTYLAPTQATDKAMLGLMSFAHPSPVPGKVEQAEETSPFGGGGYAVTDSLAWDWPLSLRMCGIEDDGGDPVGDFLSVFRSCAFDEDAPVIANGIAVRFRPTIAYGIAGSAPQTGVPKVASPTWIDGGGGNAVVYRGRDTVANLESITNEGGGLRANFAARALWYRDSGDIDSARVSRASTSLTIADVVRLSRAHHPLFKSTGMTLTVDGSTGDVAELLNSSCIESFSFAPGMTFDDQTCLQEVDGYDPAYSVIGPASALSLVATQTLATTVTSPFSAMIRDRVGGSVTMRWTIVSGLVTWGVTLKINNFEVFSVESSDSNGKRIETVTLRGKTISATSRAFEVQFDRTDTTP
jgi:hypothetical protein